MTALYENIIFGPVHSRRLGLSLGVNLLPLHCKLCTFECIYCECGWRGRNIKPEFNKRCDVNKMLSEKLEQMVNEGTPPDVITFAGNGEPTLHPEFGAIIDDTIALRNELCPSAKISVLSNATMIGRKEVREALLKVDNNILKLDSAFDETVRLINDPSCNYSVAETVANMKLFNGKLIVQTMFLRGDVKGVHIDNTSSKELEAWLKLIAEIAPYEVMVYSLDRDTPLHTLEKVSVDELKIIAGKVETLGIKCMAAG